ncbi:hypothetical protein DVV81_11535 [Clostridium botulinum]|uniref:hypothetical protein n=1 Tax=Clostridium botulinum TaxID=1491 RepID=UPI001966E7C5|nr:hypothetical protein [Clostridium botulinum]MBN1059221.1 hypothetical protein [Clostridium botulinum]MBN1062422.1 hypothetical protein [Clostridium botulinum]MBN1071792.1 hypothetical protein [Clostridium botulinum]
MVSCLLTVLSIIAILYSIKMTRYNLKEENRPKIKKIHFIIQLTITLPFVFIIIGSLFSEPFIVIITLIVLSWLIAFIYKKH